MTDNDNDGGRELVLGNKQLLAIFFVATLLCGVFFAMGYVVGGNSAKAGAAAVVADAAPAPVSEGKRDEPQPDQTQPDQPQPDQPQPPAQTADNPAQDDSASSLPSAEPRISDNPSASGIQPVAPAKPGKAVSAPKSKAAAAAPDASVSLSVPETGASYWQVAAEARPDAEVLVKQLRDRQFPAILAKSSKADLFEILVGPYRSPLSLADAKKKLIDLSFGDVFLHKP